MKAEEQPKIAEEAPEEKDEELQVDPYKIVNKTNKQIDYNKLIVKFGCYEIKEDIITRIQNLTKKKAHHFIKRGIFFAHRELNLILDAYEKHTKKDFPPFYLYTGRGPSSQALHLGHLLPFVFNKYLQQAFDVPFVIQVTDDEKYFHSKEQGAVLENSTRLAYENIKDIIACGLDPKKTFIFIDTEYIDKLYPNICRFQKHINMSTLKGIFGLEFADCCGKAAFPAIQASPCLSSCFPHIFGKENIPCLIPCGIDQDPYFRMTRDVCAKLKVPKPAGFYSKFFPALQGFDTKMSGSRPETGIFLTDSAKDIETKIKKHAFSGGKATKEEHEKYGADLTTDISYHYLRFFLEDDEQLKEIGDKYGSGKMMTSQVKKILTGVLQKVVQEHQERRAKVTDEDVKAFLSRAQRKFTYQK